VVNSTKKKPGMVVVERGLPTTRNMIDDDLLKLYVLCWHNTEGIRRISFLPGPYIEIKHYPFTGQIGYTQPAIMMRLEMNNSTSSLKKVHVVECRALASNIPYDEKLTLMPSLRNGHFRLKFKLEGKSFSQAKLTIKE